MGLKLLTYLGNSYDCTFTSRQCLKFKKYSNSLLQPTRVTFFQYFLLFFVSTPATHLLPIHLECSSLLAHQCPLVRPRCRGRYVSSGLPRSLCVSSLFCTLLPPLFCE